MSLQRKTSNDALLMKGNNALMDACCCVASCGVIGAPPVSIVGYFDGMFVPPADTFQNFFITQLWNGNLAGGNAACLDYTAGNCTYSGQNYIVPFFCRMIANGPAPGESFTVTPFCTFNSVLLRWEFGILADGISNPLNVMCLYIKTSGDNATGVYNKIPLDYVLCTRSSNVGVTSPASITIV